MALCPPCRPPKRGYLMREVSEAVASNMLNFAISTIGEADMQLEQRLCDAMFDISVRGHGSSPKPLREKAAMRVAEDLQIATQKRLKRSERAWAWKPVQRRAISKLIIKRVFSETLIDRLIEERSKTVISAVIPRVHQRHSDMIKYITTFAPTDGSYYWLIYWARNERLCTARDRDIVKMAFYACWHIAFAVETWRETCS